MCWVKNIFDSYQTDCTHINFHINPKYSDNSIDPDQNEASDQGLHCLLLTQQFLDTSTHDNFNWTSSH